MVAARLLGATDPLPRLALAASLPLTAAAVTQPAAAAVTSNAAVPNNAAATNNAATVSNNNAVATPPVTETKVTAANTPEADPARRGAHAIFAGLPEVIWHDPPEAREALLWTEIEARNFPAFAVTFVPLTLTDGKGRKATFQVACDCFAIGTEDDWLYAGLSGYYAQRTAELLNARLPTNRLVLAMYEQAAIKLTAHPFDCQTSYGGKWQRSTFALRLHGEVIQGKVACKRGGKVDEANGRLNPNLGTHAGTCALPPGAHPKVLVAGHRKEVILSHEDLAQRLAFWGFFTSEGKPIQRGFGCPHGPGFADYSHGFRLVGPTVDVDGKEVDYDEVVTSPDYASLVFAEGGQPCKKPPRYPAPPSKFAMGR